MKIIQRLKRLFSRQNYENTWFKVEHVWIGAPIGFWDIEIYRFNKCDVNKCCRLNPNILTRIFTFMTALAAAAVVAAPSSATHQKQTTPPPALKTAGSEATISESDAIAIIIGEAGGEPYAGQVAVAAVLRRRGSTRGFYGLKNPVVAKASPKTVAKARRAWCESLFDDPSNGATHFENVRAFGTPAWAAGRNPCAVIGSHTFWKLK